MRILLVEDDETIRQNIQKILSREAYAVDTAENIEIAEQKVIDENYDLIILDWMLPDGDGTTWCNKLRQQNIKSSILMLTAKNQQSDIVDGLDAGADDYMSKPFDISELKARIRSLLRRSQTDVLDLVLNVGDIQINTNTHEVKRSGKIADLSPKEYSLLYFLALHKDKYVDRLSIMSSVWSDEIDTFSNTVDVHIRYLRKKIDDNYDKKRIITVKGAGYMLCSD